MPKPTFKQTLDALKGQVLNGKSYLGIARGLAEGDPVILQVATTFFNMTINGNLELAQIAAARLYDRSKRTVTVEGMLCEAASQAGDFQHGDQGQVEEAVLKAKHRVITILPVVDAIRHRRNKWLAHLDSDIVQDPAALAKKALLTIPDLERVFKETEEIVLDLSNLYEGAIGELRYLDGDDYKSALDWIRKAKCAFIERYEQQFGRWDGPRPKDCSRKPHDLM